MKLALLCFVSCDVVVPSSQFILFIHRSIFLLLKCSLAVCKSQNALLYGFAFIFFIIQSKFRNGNRFAIWSLCAHTNYGCRSYYLSGWGQTGIHFYRICLVLKLTCSFYWHWHRVTLHACCFLPKFCLISWPTQCNALSFFPLYKKKKKKGICEHHWIKCMIIGNVENIRLVE